MSESSRAFATSIHSRSKMKEMADSLEAFLSMVDQYLIFTDMDDDEYEEYHHTVRKLIKHLRKGEGDKVYVDNVEEVIAETEAKDYPF